MNRTIKIAAIFGTMAVAIGAFGAHGLKAFLSENGRLDTFETAVKYQFYHTIALLLIGLIQLSKTSKWLDYSSNLFISGIIIFSGSLYILCLTQLNWLGVITPAGGLCFIGGWLLLLKVK